MRRRALLARLLYTAALLLTACSRENTQRTPVTLGIATWAGFGVAYVGIEKGLFPGIDLRVQILDDARARQAAFASGSLDVMISSADLFAQEAAKGIKGEVVLVTDESFGGDGIVAKPAIKTVADLKGKRVAYTQGGPSDYLLFRALDRAGVPVDSVHRIPVDDPSRAGETFLSGSVDAAVTWEPFLSNAAKDGRGHILTTSRDLPETIVDVLVASPRLASDGRTLESLIDGWLRSVAYVEAHPEESVAIMSRGLKTPEPDVRSMLNGLRLAGRERNRQFFSRDSAGSLRLAGMLSSAASYWKRVGIISPNDTVLGRTSARAASILGVSHQ